MGEQIIWLDVKGAAGHLKVAVRTIYKYVDERAIPFYRTLESSSHNGGKEGNRYRGNLRFIQSEIDEVIRKRRVETAEEALERMQEQAR